MHLVGVEIDVCPLCNGAWLDQDELSQLTRSRGKGGLKVQVVNKRPTQFHCPRCKGARLLEGCHHDDLDFLLDECESCGGLWCDRGELSRLIGR